ncbi:hypothetical protein AWQ22_02865 [Picosynechococcus sp. PCC 7117]|nr:hypothetical protein AWQ22_02865 [Picosynechococcus sp. PCC 7117]
MGTNKAEKIKANLNILLIDVMVSATFLATTGPLSFYGKFLAKTPLQISVFTQLLVVFFVN